ncbi:MAG: MgtC/SapB family protein [Bacilli bacterium]|nr:MgtC/SapB family protein [Bacilli bacterium]
MNEQTINIFDIIIRLLLAMLMAGIIGYDRENKNRPAGFRTHIMVCVGSAIVALVQVQISQNELALALKHPDISNTFIYEQGRLVAQVISGIGFLGAGTIIVTKKFVHGLTTAASLWAVACLGIAIGMGFYVISIIGFFILLITLVYLNRTINFPKIKYIEVHFNDAKTKQIICKIFDDNKIEIKDMNYSINKDKDSTNFNYHYTIDLKDPSILEEIVNNINEIEDVKKITLLNT